MLVEDQAVAVIYNAKKNWLHCTPSLRLVFIECHK